MSWTDERVNELQKLAADGFSASQIAAELGGVTRNAVIGKADRMGLKLKGKKSLARRSGGVCGSRHRKKGGQKAQPPAESTLPAVLPEGPDEGEGPNPKYEEPAHYYGVGGVDLLGLTENTCKWPLGAGFCGNSVEKKGASYCSKHADMVYAR